MIRAADFVSRVEQIAQRRLRYRIGGTGRDGTCDCIGLIMGAMYELGRGKYAMHSTNYFARYQTMELKKADEKALFIGQLLYRARESTAQLHARYQMGGRYYTGDRLDYYHVGVVTGIRPLRIIECTQTGNVDGIAVRDRFQNWQYGGKLRGIDYAALQAGEEGEPMESKVVQMDAIYEARVATREDPLSLRDAPGGSKIGELPRNATVQVLEEGEWAHVRFGDLVGYASMQYLERIGESGGMRIRTILTDETGDTWEPVGVYWASSVIEAESRD